MTDNDSVSTEIDIAAPPERVFKALTDSAEAHKWGQHKDYQLTVWDMDPRVGGKWRFVSHEVATGKDYVHDGEILEYDPPRLLVYTWIAAFHEVPDQVTTVRWELTPTPQGTHVKVIHSGLANLPKSRESYRGGWPGFVAAIKNYLEKK